VNDGPPQPVLLTEEENGDKIIRLGNQSARIQMAALGDTTSIRAFGRTFTLNIAEPVEQAAEDAGGNSNTARCPMPGMVVEINVTVDEPVIKGQSLATIESMKILTVIKAPRSGKVAQIHMEPGQSFEKNAVLVTLAKEEAE
jgi:biotin carboxyl carrier protein